MADVPNDFDPDEHRRAYREWEMRNQSRRDRHLRVFRNVWEAGEEYVPVPSGVHPRWPVNPLRYFDETPPAA